MSMIPKDEKRMVLAMLPVLAINSAKMFNFYWGGAFLESVRARVVEYTCFETRTHHDPAIKAFGTNSGNDVPTPCFR